MVYRICKAFEVESGHMLSKHPERCRFPHGHSRRIEVVLSSQTLDEHDMVCDFQALKLAVGDLVDRFDHAMAINSQDPAAEALASMSDRVIVFENQDPTTEVLAQHIYEELAGRLASGASWTNERGRSFSFPPGITLERVRVGETSSSWAEYGIG